VCPAGHSWNAADPTSRCPVCGLPDISVSRADPVQGSGGTLVHPPLDPTAGSSTLNASPVPPATDSDSPHAPTSCDSTLAATGLPPAIRFGRKMIGGCEILEPSGGGGWGAVSRARQEGLNRLVAIKTILAGAHASDDELQRFRSEAEAVARL